MGIKKGMSLRIAFWKFLIWLLAGITCSVVIPFSIAVLGVSLGITTYANYSEQLIKKLVPVIEASPDFSDIQLPVGSRYVRLDKDYQILETTMEEHDLKYALEYVTTGIQNGSRKQQYVLAVREKEYIILSYHIGSQFTNEWLNTHLPSPENLIYLLIAFNCLVVCTVLTASLAKLLKKELQPLFQATKEVADQNLDFVVGHSKIKEFEEMLLAFTDMKEELKASLEQQWKAEQLQREQIAALAHDLKTPLTIVQGNADLLNETTLTQEQQTYIDYITKSSEQIQQYIQLLIEITRTSTGYQLKKELINCEEWLGDLQQQINTLCQPKQITLELTNQNPPANINIDKLLMERAIMNIINNAIDYAPTKSTLHMRTEKNNNYLNITITDEGPGFTPEALLHAPDQFYTSDPSRHNHLHYGLGLYITQTLTHHHNGRINISNSPITKGAEVTLTIPIT